MTQTERYADAGERLHDLDRRTQVEVSIVIPCLNEAATLGACIDKASRSLQELGVHGEVVVADNGSTDGSESIAAEHGARVVHVQRRGYGSALMAGIAAARGEFVVMGDADDSYDFSNLHPFVERLREGYDLVVGNRFAGGIHPGAMPFLHKYLGNPVLTRIAKRFFGSPVGDVYCGLRGFRRSAIQSLDLRATGMEFAIEMVIKASFGGLRIAEVPTTLAPDRRGRPPHLRTWRDGWRSLRFLLLYSPTWLFLYPGLALMALGTGTMIWLLPETRRIGDVAFDAHTLAYAGLAVVVGFQAATFGVFAKVFAITEGLLPPDRRFARFARPNLLEIGILVGAALVVVGIGASVYALFLWNEKSFGALDYSQTLRIVIPAVTLIALGFQIVLSSFFISILGLKRR
jgi:glycosyltransferase involved in cell wall biosynthesis